MVTFNGPLLMVFAKIASSVSDWLSIYVALSNHAPKFKLYHGNTPVSPQYRLRRLWVCHYSVDIQTLAFFHKVLIEKYLTVVDGYRSLNVVGNFNYTQISHLICLDGSHL